MVRGHQLQVEELRGRWAALSRRLVLRHLLRGLLLMRVGVLALACAVGCAGAITGPAGLEGRDDLELEVKRAHISGGLSEPIRFEVPDGVSSILFQVRGGRGLYSLAEF